LEDVNSGRVAKSSMADAKSMIDRVSTKSKGLNITKNYNSRDNMRIDHRALSNAKEFELKQKEKLVGGMHKTFFLNRGSELASPQQSNLVEDLMVD
jgi:hypothetical protein